MESVLRCKIKLCQQFEALDKLVGAFCVFWFIYALKHRECSSFKIISVQAAQIAQDEFL